MKIYVMYDNVTDTSYKVFESTSNNGYPHAILVTPEGTPSAECTCGGWIMVGKNISHKCIVNSYKNHIKHQVRD